MNVNGILAPKNTPATGPRHEICFQSVDPQQTMGSLKSNTFQTSAPKNYGWVT